MATAVGLNMKMTADTSGLGRGMTRAEKLLNGIDKNARSSARSLRAIATIQIGGALLKGLGSIAGTLNAVTRSAVNYASGLASSIDETAKLAARTGIAVEALQGFQVAADLSGVQNLESAIQRLTITIGDAGAGVKEPQRAFERLGLNFEELAALRPEDQFRQVADAFQGVGTQAEKAAIAADLFGRSGVELLPLFNSNLAEIEARARRLGIVLGREQTAAIEQMNDALNLVRKTLDGIVGQVLAELSTVVTAIAEEFLQFVEAFKGFDGAQGGNAIAQLITKTIVDGLESFLNVLKSLGNGLITLLDALGRVSARIAELFGFDLRSDRQRQLEQERSVVNRDLTNVQRGAAQAQAQGRDTTAAQEAIDTLRARLEDLNKQIAQESGEGLAELLRAGLNQGIDAAIAANQRVADRLADNAAAAEPVVQADAADRDVAAVEAAVAFNEKAWEAGLNEFERKFFGLDKPDVAAAVNPAIQRIADAIEASEKQRDDRAESIEAARLESLSRVSNEALNISDIRSGGISEVLRIATGREDPAIEEYRKQLSELRKIEQRLRGLEAEKVAILG